MTLHNKRSPAHHIHKARQETPTLPVTPPTEEKPTTTPSVTPSASPSPNPSPSTSPPPPSSTSKTSSRTSPPASPTPTPNPSPSDTTTTADTNTNTNTDTTTNTNTSASDSSSSESSSESTSSQTGTTSGTTTTSPPVTTITGPAVTRTQTSSLAKFSTTIIDNAAITISASPTASPSSGISTGAIVGSVAGGIAIIAVIGIIVAFFLRRWRRNRISDADFNQDEFIRSPNMMESEFRDGHGGYRASTFDPVPPSMSQQAHQSIAPSLSSGSNLAGQGAYPYTGGAIQERQPYTYGQAYTDNNIAREDESSSEIAHGGAYSSQPQPQAAYNPEAYASYAYSTDQHSPGSSDSRSPQIYHPYQTAEYQPRYQDHAPPALVAGAPAVAAGRSTRPVINDDDAYGGI
ncbi:hypothetical protein Hypma_000236 [Hypsizygus marmoreus]|uniref:Uncharacterized protein n=1 Tax=Hypsizygus marmoreus TaxID=39966 RepID=A0A369J8T4_HYPMA|nr:hypothetical protein Hypma_000236 [Hypsizygus marmoreus]